MRENFKNVKWNIREITADEAREHLDRTRNAVSAGLCKQRSISEASVMTLRCDISARAFIPINNSVAIDERGYVVDGQHRLKAIADSGITTLCSISTGWPVAIRINGVDMDFIDAIDRGRVRGVGTQLNLKGYSGGNNWAAVARAIALLSTSDDSLKVSTYQTDFIIEKLYQKDIQAIFDLTQGARQKSGYVCGPLAMLHNADKAKAQEFAAKFFSLVDLAQGHPALALDTWIRNHRSGMDRMISMRVVCSCMFHFCHGNKISKVYASHEHTDWLLSQQKTNIRKIQELFSPDKRLI